MNKKYHICYYVENNSHRLKKFKTLKALREFVEDFESTVRLHEDTHWIDFTVENITGTLSIYEESLELEIA